MVGMPSLWPPTGSKRSKSSRTLVGFVTGMVTAGPHLIPRHLTADHAQAKAGSQGEDAPSKSSGKAVVVAAP